MHGIEITEHVLHNQRVNYLLVQKDREKDKVGAALYKYLKKKRKILKFKPIRKFKKKAEKKIRKMIRAIGRITNPTPSIQAT